MRKFEKENSIEISVFYGETAVFCTRADKGPGLVVRMSAALQAALNCCPL
jgi:hypothetical protein